MPRPLRARITAALAALVVAGLLAALPGGAFAARPPGAGKPPKPTPTATATPTPPGGSIVSFAGYDWTVKSSNGKVGPGPNTFSAANVSVAADGLHLRIAKAGNRWTTAEVINRAYLGYGTYEWTVATSLAGLDPSVVLGLFTWSDAPAYAHRELDIELARWGSATDPTNGQFVVQPYDAAGHLVRYTQPPGGGSVLRFTWAPSRVDFETLAAGGAGPVIASWSYVGPDIPVPAGDGPDAERARMNLWLFRGQAPTDRQPVEIVISDFRFTPPPG